MPTPTATPSTAEIVRDATAIVNTWNSLTPLMAVLGVAALALIIVLLISRNSGNATNNTVKVLTTTITRLEDENVTLKQDAKEFQKMHLESLTVIGNQATRSNDTLDALNRRGIERDADQKLMAATLNTLVSDGSIPLRKLMADVAGIVAIINALDTRTAHLPELAISIPALRADLNAKLDSVMSELAKRSTKPIQQLPVEPPKTENGNS